MNKIAKYAACLLLIIQLNNKAYGHDVIELLKETTQDVIESDGLNTNNDWIATLRAYSPEFLEKFKTYIFDAIKNQLKSVVNDIQILNAIEKAINFDSKVTK